MWWSRAQLWSVYIHTHNHINTATHPSKYNHAYTQRRIYLAHGSYRHISMHTLTDIQKCIHIYNTLNCGALLLSVWSQGEGDGFKSLRAQDWDEWAGVFRRRGQVTVVSESILTLFLCLKLPDLLQCQCFVVKAHFLLQKPVHLPTVITFLPALAQ